MSKDQDLKLLKGVEIVEKYKAKGYRYCVHTIRLHSSSFKFYKTYSAAKREMHRKLENPKNLLSTVITVDGYKYID